MLNVNSRKCINRLSYRSIKNNRTRNIIAIAAIILTSIMFTVLFTVGASMLASIQESTMRQVGTRAHGGFKFITQQQYDKIKADPKVKDISYNITIGYGENPQFSKINVEIRSTEDKSAKWSFAYPTVGKLPTEGLEIATSTKVLDALGIEHRIGVKVPLEFTTNGVKHSEGFTLCGYWESDGVLAAEEVYLSRSYCDEVAPVWQSVRETNGDWSYLSGSINPSIWFSSAWDIEGQMSALKERCGFGDDVNDGVNWAYASSEVDFATVALIIFILLLIVVSGYLIIYNVFYISVSGDIRFYGLLKTIGMTNRQLKKIVHRQALLLGAAGGAAGLLSGYIISTLIVPSVMSAAAEGIECVISANPLIFVLSGIFTLVTVWVSCIRPCGLVSRISPVEAAKYTEGDAPNRKRKKTRSVSPVSMAYNNIIRTPKKAISVILSLSLSLIMLNSAVSIVRGFDMDKYIKNSIVSDFCITDASIVNTASAIDVFNGITPDIQDSFKTIEGVTDFGSVYMREGRHRLSDSAFKNTQSILEKYKADLTENTDEMVRLVNEEHIMAEHLYGADDFILGKLEIYKGKLDKEKFKTGNYVVVSTFSADGDGAYYNIGDRVTIDYGGGKTKEYEVMALGDIPYALGPEHTHFVDIYFTMPSDEFIQQTGETGALKSAFNVLPEYYVGAEEQVKSYCENTELDYRSKQIYVDKFKSTQNMYLLVGGALSLILALIGILNFINACLTSIQTRKRELAILQSIGMTGAQLKKMLVAEGVLYIAITGIFSVSVGSLITYGTVSAISSQMWFFTYRFGIMPIILGILAFSAAAVIIPIICYKAICRKSIVERLRTGE